MIHTISAARCWLRFCGTRGSAGWTTWSSRTITPTMRLGFASSFAISTWGRFGRAESPGMTQKAGIIRSRLDEIALKRKIKIRTFPDLFEDVQIGQTRIRLLHPTRDFLETSLKRT